MEVKEKDQQLSLKVMRLARPSLFTGIGVGCDSQDVPGDILNQDMRNDTAIPHPNTGVGQMLLLPQSFGNIYLGETFSCCICIHNSSNQAVYDVGVKALLQMSNQRVPLHGDEPDLQQLPADDIINKIVRHEVKEVGTHILVCSVQYKGTGGIEQNFRKFFKFQVMKPLDVKTKFYNAESDEVYLEAGIQNITSGPIFLERVALEPGPCYTVEPLNTCFPSSVSVFGSCGASNPHDTRQYFFCLKPNMDAKKKPQVLKQNVNIGKLDIVWRSNMGDKGRLQTSQLQRMVWSSQYGDLKVTVVEIASSVTLEQPFNMTISINNISEKDLSLRLELLPSSECTDPSNNKATEWHNCPSRTLDLIRVGESLDVSLTLMAVKVGLVTIAGIRLTDMFLKRSYDYENLAQVFVAS